VTSQARPGPASIASAIQPFGYSGCAGRGAQDFGDHPETAGSRMRWAHVVARKAFADQRSEPGAC